MEYMEYTFSGFKIFIHYKSIILYSNTNHMDNTKNCLPELDIGYYVAFDLFNRFNRWIKLHKQTCL